MKHDPAIMEWGEGGGGGVRCPDTCWYRRGGAGGEKVATGPGSVEEGMGGTWLKHDRGIRGRVVGGTGRRVITTLLGEWGVRERG